ncbi:MAG: winged helix-turn-helix transcriptional regulator [Candidatus Aenigmarchaeota archaeon]|nr:winged helix-turn-helix transcriptional regulator [Candidatus Aenigmarchaeota archaeon]
MEAQDRYLNLEVRRRLYNCISQSPGLHFREIQRRVGLATGSLDYHLHFLHKNGLLRTERQGKYLRYYTVAREWGEEERHVLSLLRNEKIRHILIYLIDNKKALPTRIAGHLNISNSTLSWYLKNLEEKGVITQTKRGRYRIYRVKEPEKIVKYIILHKASFLDEIVDRFAEAWEGV